jgi:hypothetical protein
MSVKRTRSLSYFFTFKESKKSLTMDSVRNVLLDQFNECERIRSLDDLFNFRGSEKGLKGDPLCFGSLEDKTKSEKYPCE